MDKKQVRILIRVFLRWAGTRQFDMVAARHSLAAKEEMQELAADFMQLAQKSDVKAPVLDLLYNVQIRKECKVQDSMHSDRIYVKTGVSDVL